MRVIEARQDMGQQTQFNEQRQGAATASLAAQKRLLSVEQLLLLLLSLCALQISPL
jgi:hypothetical protein